MLRLVVVAGLIAGAEAQFGRKKKQDAAEAMRAELEAEDAARMEEIDALGAARAAG